jgi:hypothetical protein
MTPEHSENTLSNCLAWINVFRLTWNQGIEGIVNLAKELGS